MQFYILPEKLDEFKKKVARAMKHLSVKPVISYSEPMQKKKHTNIAWRCDGEAGIDKYVNVITVIEVTMDEITSGGWSLVANVFYREGFVTTVDTKLFKDIPSKFGLKYDSCDYCGHRHKNRIEAHIIHNAETGEWKQIGTSCGKKMFEGGDICQFMVKLYEVIQQVFGCAGEESWVGWCASLPDHSWKRAYSVDMMIAGVVDYRDEVNKEWEKAYHKDDGTRYGTKVPGTTTKFKERFEEVYDTLSVDKSYCDKVRAFVATLPDDTEVKEDPTDFTKIVTVPGFNSNIKQAFADEFLPPYDVYKVWFAVKMYEESLTMSDWESKVKGIEKGEFVTLRNAKLVSKQLVEDFYYGNSWAVRFDYDGVIYHKDFSSIDSLDSKYKNEDGTYSFSAMCRYINNTKRIVYLGGRIRKAS